MNVVIVMRKMIRIESTFQCNNDKFLISYQTYVVVQRWAPSFFKSQMENNEPIGGDATNNIGIEENRLVYVKFCEMAKLQDKP